MDTFEYTGRSNHHGDIMRCTSVHRLVATRELDLVPLSACATETGEDWTAYMVFRADMFDAWLESEGWSRDGRRLVPPSDFDPGYDSNVCEVLTGHYASRIGVEGCPGRWFSRGSWLASAGKRVVVVAMGSSLDI